MDPLEPPLGKWYAPVYDSAKVYFFMALLLLPWVLAVLSGCGGVGNLPISTPYLDEVGVERSRQVCMYAGVPVERLPDCIQREMASRRESQFLGPWSPL